MRHLLELLDGAVGRVYEEEGFAYRPRYTPLVRALMQDEPMTIGQLAEASDTTQPATTQTLALMVKDGLVLSEPGPVDGRQRWIRLSPSGRALLPGLQSRWKATASAAASLDAELPVPLSEVLERAIQALETKSFDERVASARGRQSKRRGA
ncbi:MarR family transcriptional regulator [Myxococcus llanfairpwllgwyngyllgogerychwyrndrobwllllantysiliogogogochensis]|uniref:MarR family transcriptional regulator n=1 Tax=Myxococcus llanfairpwllgwyngyllgogerychwyrndrobwllllantysiliogogogochensis TaxID=2590453 RepID=A0A540WTI4_9BACT|nr:MarR family transcriptional regulator [Myxococcus llanfairpwllgwyngyllgogerychwyrndrobwllllantysiliogogogochensis]TQF12322.1 MarR family transcriptional regulator [Myxococcus llanfairpwllgwyngyllgogerychwyrndrobwllllantysiliogogogochensis]